MAITTARIQVRRGLYAEFEPTKLMPGEWAVSVDVETSRQVVWMCFSPGVTKRMGTLEDFEEQIKEVTEHILEGYKTQLDEFTIQKIDEIEEYKATVLLEIKQVRDEVSKMKESVDTSFIYVSNFDKKLQEELIPQIETWYNASQQYAKDSERWAVGREEIPESLEDNSKYYSERAKAEYEKAKNEANRAEQYSKINLPRFHIDPNTMELIQEDGAKGIEFTLTENKELLFEYVEQEG